MSTELSKKNQSRQAARKLWKELYCDLPKDIVVHHKDHNPLNNDLNNLTVMVAGDHIRHHLTGKKWLRFPEKTLRELDLAILLYNDYR